MADLEGLSVAVIDGKRDEVVAKVQQAIDEKVPPGKILNEGLVAGMSVVGKRFQKNVIYVPEVLIAARAMKGGMELLKPLLAEAGVEPVAVVVIGTVKGDLHDIGKNLVASLLEGGGFDVIDLGADVSVDKFVAAVKEKDPDLVCMSALLTVTMPSMKTTITALREAGIRDQVKVMIGGAPVTPEYASEIGADGYADNASSAVGKARELMAA